MRSLFLKIFLWYLLTTVVVFGTLLFVAVRLEVRSRPDPFPRLFDQLMRTSAAEAARAWEAGGDTALGEVLQRLETESGVAATLFNERAEPVLDLAAGSASSRRVKELLQEVAADAADPAPPSRWPAAVTVSPNGRRYVLLAENRPRGPLPIVPLISIVITATIVSYWLAKYVTGPVQQLRSATVRLAAGDLKARVGRGMRARRDVHGDLGRDFDHMAERIESLVAAQHRLLRDVSHELRSPLARLHVALGLAERRAGVDAAEPLARIEHEAEALGALIDELLTLARLDASGEEPHLDAVDLREIVQAVAADADFEARARGRGVRVLDGPACRVRGARELLHRAVENVVRNAIQHTAEGTTVEVAIAWEERAAAARLTVRDRGSGVPESALAAIFRPFYRVSDARDRQTGGAGLGLAIAERIIRHHGGSIRAGNAAEGGLIVEITIPGAGPA